MEVSRVSVRIAPVAHRSVIVVNITARNSEHAWPPSGNLGGTQALLSWNRHRSETMGRGILLWLLGVPIPVILLLAMCSHH